MILSNVEIVDCLNRGAFSINNLAGVDPTKPPFNTSAVDLRLDHQIRVPRDGPTPLAIDLRRGGVAQYLTAHTEPKTITNSQPYILEKGQFLLAQTLEKVSFPIKADAMCYSARVEGKSSLARCGILVHFTAPTIHAGFSGPITLEMINLGPLPFLLIPGIFVCQIIIEQIEGCPLQTPTTFSQQTDPTGARGASQ